MCYRVRNSISARASVSNCSSSSENEPILWFQRGVFKSRRTPVTTYLSNVPMQPVRIIS